MKLDTLKELLTESESIYLDWKMDFPQELIHGKKHKTWDMGRGKVLKSIVSLANCHNSDRAYLVYGVKDRGAEREVVGISKTVDDADFQQWSENTFDPPPTFSYSEVQWDNSIIIGCSKLKEHLITHML